MKLNRKGREELRALVEKELKAVPEGKLIELDGEILELLLFEKVVYKNSPKRVLKLPVWSGSFLQKLDLSKISFEDVSWTLLAKGKDSKLGSQFFDEDCWQKFLINYGKASTNRIDYSKTNIKVDFHSSWEMKVKKEAQVETGIEVINCDFSFVDFSSVDTSDFEEIRNSNFSNTKLSFSKALMKKTKPIFWYTDLSGNNLGSFMIKLSDIVTNGGPVIGLGCNLANTRLSILLEPQNLEDKVARSNFRTILLAGDLNGCYINGKRVLSAEERKLLADKKREEYEQFKQDISDSISSSIQKQLGAFKK